MLPILWLAKFSSVNILKTLKWMVNFFVLFAHCSCSSVTRFSNIPDCFPHVPTGLYGSCYGGNRRFLHTDFSTVSICFLKFFVRTLFNIRYLRELVFLSITDFSFVSCVINCQSFSYRVQPKIFIIYHMWYETEMSYSKKIIRVRTKY